MPMMSRSFYVDSLILKKPQPQTTAMALSSSASYQSALLHHRLHPLSGHPLHCLPRSQADMLGGCCPLCVAPPGIGLPVSTPHSVSMSMMKGLSSVASLNQHHPQLIPTTSYSSSISKQQQSSPSSHQHPTHPHDPHPQSPETPELDTVTPTHPLQQSPGPAQDTLHEPRYVTYFTMSLGPCTN